MFEIEIEIEIETKIKQLGTSSPKESSSFSKGSYAKGETACNDEPTISRLHQG
jgi:hypothetical protein